MVDYSCFTFYFYCRILHKYEYRCYKDVISCITKCEVVKRKGLNGEFGSTMQFWLKYVEMIETLQQLHFAFNKNNLSLKLQSWEKYLPLCFTTNKVHYARYGTNHIQQLKQLENFHPGTFRDTESFISVRRNNYGIGQAVDLAAEQTYIQNASSLIIRDNLQIWLCCCKQIKAN